MSSARDELHRQVDELPEHLVGEVVDFVTTLKARRKELPHPPDYARAQAILDSLPEDDEPLTDEERAEILAAREEYRVHGGIPFAQVMADLDTRCVGRSSSRLPPHVPSRSSTDPSAT